MSSHSRCSRFLLFIVWDENELNSCQEVKFTFWINCYLKKKGTSPLSFIADANCWFSCARTPTWTDSSSSARRESWTSRYLLPPTSSTAWRSEQKALYPLKFHVLWLRQNQDLDNWTLLDFPLYFLICFHPPPPLPPPLPPPFRL